MVDTVKMTKKAYEALKKKEDNYEALELGLAGYIIWLGKRSQVEYMEFMSQIDKYNNSNPKRPLEL